MAGQALPTEQGAFAGARIIPETGEISSNICSIKWKLVTITPGVIVTS